MSELSDKEILIMMTTKCADLGAQLAEAREEAQRVRKKMFWIWYAIGFCLDNKRITEVREVFEEKLKEKGDE